MHVGTSSEGKPATKDAKSEKKKKTGFAGGRLQKNKLGATLKIILMFMEGNATKVGRSENHAHIQFRVQPVKEIKEPNPGLHALVTRQNLLENLSFHCGWEENSGRRLLPPRRKFPLLVPEQNANHSQEWSNNKSLNTAKHCKEKDGIAFNQQKTATKTGYKDRRNYCFKVARKILIKTGAATCLIC